MSQNDYNDLGELIVLLVIVAIVVIVIAVVLSLASIMAGVGALIGGASAIKNYVISFINNVKPETAL